MFNFFILSLEAIGYTKNLQSFYANYEISYASYRFYTFFLAFYTLIFTSYLTIDFWYNKPEKLNRNKKIRRTVLYERKAIFNVFVLWAFRFIVLTYVFSNSSILYCLQLYEDYKYIFYLFAIVLFLELLVGFKRAFKTKFLHSLILFMFFVVISYLYSSIRPYNEKVQLKRLNVSYNDKNLDLPILNMNINEIHTHGNYSLYYTKNKELFIGNSKISLNNLDKGLSLKEKKLQQFFENIEISYKARSYINFYVERTLAMKDVNPVFEILASKGFKIVYVKIKNKSYDCNNYIFTISINLINRNYNFYIESSVAGSPPPPPPPLYQPIRGIADYFYNESDILKITAEQDGVFYNNAKIDMKNLSDSITLNLRKNRIISLKFSNEISFQEYIELLELIRNSVYVKRNELSKKLFDLTYNELKYLKQYESNPLFKKQYIEYYKIVKEETPFLLNEKVLIKSHRQ